MAKFEEQFPEALDFLSRSMRAGHAFTISLEMLGDEMAIRWARSSAPCSTSRTWERRSKWRCAIWCRRVPLLDVAFSPPSVMMQKQTGGNLSEILSRLAYVIRERFRLKGQVKAASAHGRMTAAILTVMPIVTMLGLLIVAPGYLQGMAADPDGKWLVVGSIVAQVIGNLCIRKIINIKV